MSTLEGALRPNWAARQTNGDYYIKFGTGTASFAPITKPAPRIPGDPLGVVPVEMAPEPGQVSCDGCCFAEADWECSNKTAPCLADNRPDGVMVIYITLAEAIAQGIVRHSWSDA